MKIPNRLGFGPSERAARIRQRATAASHTRHSENAVLLRRHRKGGEGCVRARDHRRRVTGSSDRVPPIPPRIAPPTKMTPAPLSPRSDLLTGSVNFDNKASLDAKNVADGLKISGSCVQKGGAGDPTGTVKATYDLASDVVAETEVGLPSNKITASLAHSGLLKGLKATLSGNPQDVKTAKLALQYLQGAVGLKADLTDLTAGAPKADVSLCWSEGDLAAGVSGSVDTKAFPDPAALPGKLSYAVQSTGVVPDSTVALALSDAFDTVKTSIVTKARPDPASRC